MLRGRALFESGFGVADVNERQSEGWVFRKTKLSEEFDFEDAQEKLPESTHMLMLVRSDTGRLRFFTHAARPDPRAGDTIISFSPPAERHKDQVARRAQKNGGGSSPQPA